jgi:histidinol-phosphate aminotransferase
MEHIVCGAGADEVIDLLGRAFVEPGDLIVDLPPTFGMYKWEADVLGAQYMSVPRRADFSIDVDAVAGVVEAAHASGLPPKLLFVSNPNNPDGSVTPRVDLLRLLDLPVVVVVDEAYIDFSSERSLATRVPDCSNLVVLRTFSKLAGLAGLRVGYGVLPRVIINHLWKVKQPGTMAALGALTDREWLTTSVDAIVAERGRMSARLADLGWLTPLPSHTNFVLCRVGGGREARAVKEGLEQHGVLVRYFDKDWLRDCVRISVGRPEQTDALLDGLTRLS